MDLNFGVTSVGHNVARSTQLMTAWNKKRNSRRFFWWHSIWLCGNYWGILRCRCNKHNIASADKLWSTTSARVSLPLTLLSLVFLSSFAIRGVCLFGLHSWQHSANSSRRLDRSLLRRCTRCTISPRVSYSHRCHYFIHGDVWITRSLGFHWQDSLV